jgi:hypothetical protein
MMSDFKQRLIDEHGELKGKLLRLQTFLEHPNSKQIVGSDEQERLMVKQERIMHTYVGVLEARIRLL